MARQLSIEAQLPPLYSPVNRPSDVYIGDDEVGETPAALPEPVRPPRLDETDDVSAEDSTPGSRPTQPLPPPSLLSPAFTPPSTPGNSTPSSIGVIGLEGTLPKGVPVDSTTSTGGCGSKRPLLLETLPEVRCTVRARIPNNRTGKEMWLHVYENDVDNKEHLAIVFGEHIRSTTLDAPLAGESEFARMARGAYTGKLFRGRVESGMSHGAAPDDRPLVPTASSIVTRELARSRREAPLVRVHSECYTGETVWSARCDCGEQLDEAARLMSLVERESGGIIIYLRQEGRGIGLAEKLKAYNLQDLGSDTVEANLLLRHPADARTYGLATAMLLDLGQREVRLLTNNPDKIRAVEGPHREVIVKERVPMIPLSWRGRGGIRGPDLDRYLQTKIEKMGHMLPPQSLQ